MSTELERAVAALDRRFMLDYPRDAAARIEQLPRGAAVAALRDHDAADLAPAFSYLAPDVAMAIVDELPEALAATLLAELPPNTATRFVSTLEPRARDLILRKINPRVATEIRRLLTYPANSAGQLMETRVRHFRDTATVEMTLERLRQARARASRSIFVVDSDDRLAGKISIQELALASPSSRLKELMEPVAAVVNPMAPREEVVELLETHRLVDLPVVGVEGHLLGMIYHKTLLQAIQEDATADIQTMVGASREERALSPALFAVRKRLPWLQINLLTAFLAAAVVGLFESTIAQFTALAVLLPVVAGQSGNAGAQALAVTMRGLALREIGLRHWLRVTIKEVQTGFINGLAVALTCGIGVFVWSGSLGLVLVIASSMVLAMIAAGLAGAVVPIGLTRVGQDPAQSSSIILTTVTDIAGFFSFLGIATLLAGLI